MTKAKLMIGSVLAASAMAVCSGCATISTSKVGTLDGITVKGAEGAPVEHVWLGTYGEYLFWTIPLGTGRFYWNEKKNKLETGIAWFQDCVGIGELQEALLKYAESRNCDVVDVSYYDADTSYAGASYEGLIGMFFGSSEMGVSALLVPRGNAAEAEKQ
ncbi:MAG: hypothetical protein E7049_07765 [Lentisphaerae bacterium]|jgi:hypothetical protein|nr:hypothetical protein [Lentisphaerota bacterium]